MTYFTRFVYNLEYGKVNGEEYKTRGVGDILQFKQFGLIYPGADDKPDPRIIHRCDLHVRLSDLLPVLRDGFETTDTDSETSKSIIYTEDQVEKALRNLKELMKDEIKDDDDTLILSSTRFQSYGQNKKWLYDTLVRIVNVSRVSSDMFYLSVFIIAVSLGFGA